MANRITFLVDGFNLYHSVVDLHADTGANCRWLDVDYRCGSCGHVGTIVRHEEKETDVAIGSRLIELSFRDAVDGIAVMSGDTDLIPAIRTARRVSSGKPVYVILPYKRYNDAFDRLVAKRFKLKAFHYKAHQFPDPITLADGTTISCPVEWVPPIPSRASS